MNIETEAEKIRLELEKFRLPMIKLVPKAEPAEDVWSSKFGGKPYWPKGMDYPTAQNEEPLFLLAQLNFEQLPRLAGYPEHGILQFFIGDDGLYGLDFERPIEEIIQSPGGYRVVYHPHIEINPTALKTDLPEISAERELPLAREYRIEGALESEIPSPTDYRFARYAADPFDYEDPLAEYLYDHFSAEGSKIGGYANFTQQDPRTGQAEDNWLLLFQMDSEYGEDVEIMWGDMGVCNFFIEKEALRNHDFSRVWYNWDCS